MAISDTTIEASAVQLAIFRRLGPEGRLQLAFEASGLARELFEAGLRTRYPEMSESEIKREAIRLLYGIAGRS